MRTEDEVRAEIDHLTRSLHTTQRKGTMTYLVTRINALRWVLGEDEM